MKIANWTKKVKPNYCDIVINKKTRELRIMLKFKKLLNNIYDDFVKVSFNIYQIFCSHWGCLETEIHQTKKCQLIGKERSEMNQIF